MENENLNEVNTDSLIRNSFTLEENKVNLEVNRLNANCIGSVNNKFSLDSEGNLVVNSITTRTNSNTFNVDLMYPVGSIYMNMSDINPTLFFGGVWEAINGKFLLSSSETHEAGSTGGEETHTLTVDELPSHSHGNKSLVGDFWNYRGQDSSYTGTASGIFSMTKTDGSAPYGSGGFAANKNDTLHINASHEHNVVGNNASHNNMPPYLTVYMWKRVA